MDDALRLAYTAVHADETAESAVEFLWFAVAWYKQHGINAERVLADNGAGYKSRKFRQACRGSGIQLKRMNRTIRKSMERRNGFIRTALKEWAHAGTYTPMETNPDLPYGRIGTISCVHIPLLAGIRQLPGSRAGKNL